MKLIDMHCDTLSKLVLRDNESLTTNTLCIDLNGLRRADSMVQFFACFADKEDYREPYSCDVAYHMIFRMIERMRQEISFMDDTALKLGVFDQRSFYCAFNEFDNQSIEDSLKSDNLIVKIFAVLDRRVGKRRLLAMQDEISKEPEMFQIFYSIRKKAETI